MDDRDNDIQLMDQPGTARVFDGEWLLEGFYDGSGKRVRTPSLTFPCQVGRNAGLEVTLPFASVSGVHAELYLRQGQLYLRDLGSTNGTYLNRERVTEETACAHGDVLHFGRQELRLIRLAAQLPADVTGTGTVELDLSQGGLPSRLVLGIRQLDDLLRNRSIEPHFQPIVDLQQRTVLGFEILGRGAHSMLPTSPFELFEIAEEVGMEAELSKSFRDVGMEVGAALAGRRALYLNTHPAELLNPDELFSSLAALRDRHREATLVLEVHESAAVGSTAMKVLRSELNKLDIQLAYDDFGAGQSRLAQLLEVPPEIVKFDMCIVRDIHLAESTKKTMVGSLISMLKQEGVHCLAEGVETEDEASVCAELGFDLAQGFLFGRPNPASDWLDV